MLIAVNAGNSHVLLGGYEEDVRVFAASIATDPKQTGDDYACKLRQVFDLYGVDAKQIHGAVLGSVVPGLVAVLEQALRLLGVQDIIEVSSGVKTGLNIRMDNPASLGGDLVVNAVAGIKEYEAPMLIFDLGTATTVSVIDKDRRYQGGMIYPGVGVSLDSLTARAAQLSGISLEAPEHLIGKNTIECMKSGVIYSSAAAIDGIIDRMKEELGGKATVIATGGLAKKIVPHCRRDVILDDDLLLKGLSILYYKNKK